MGKKASWGGKLLPPSPIKKHDSHVRYNMDGAIFLIA